MPVETLERPVPAENLFPSWRGRLPFSQRVGPATEALKRANPALSGAIETLNFETFEAAHAGLGPVHKYNEIPAQAAALVARLPEAIRSPWLCALLLWHISRFDAVFAASGLDPEFALHYADSFNRIIDQIEADAGFAEAGSDSFLKDLW